jgi:tetratricopeptide (TPR) repeat protein
MRRLWILVLMVAACGSNAGGKRAVKGGKGGKAVELDPVKPEAMKEFDKALRAMRLGGPEAIETARDRFEEAARLDPTLWEAWYDLGVLDFDDGDDDGAIDAFSHALKIDPAHTPSRIGRAQASARAGKTDDARDDFKQSLSELSDDDPRRADVSARLASLLRNAKKYDDAIDVLRDTLRLQGATSRIYTELGLIYLAEERADLAELVLARALELDSKDPAAHNALALLFQQQGKAQEAFDQFDLATSLDPDYLEARFNKGSVLLDAGDYARAKQELAIVVDKEPEDWAAQVAYGLALRGLKDWKGAKSTWDKVIKNAPRRSWARSDALYDLVILKAYFTEDLEGAKADLERYLQDAPTSHPKRQEAEQKRKELGS